MKPQPPDHIIQALPKLEAQTLSWQDYITRFGNKKARKDALQITLNQAGAKYIATELNAEHQTLKFEVCDELPGEHHA